MTIFQRGIIQLIRAYQRTLSPDHGWWRRPTCRFFPNCSEYAIDAVSVHGVMVGSWKALRRVLRCHPFAQGGFDPIS